MNVLDIQRMSDTDLVERIDALVKGDSVKGEIDDDTVLWQQLRIELDFRLARCRRLQAGFQAVSTELSAIHAMEHFKDTGLGHVGIGQE